MSLPEELLRPVLDQPQEDAPRRACADWWATQPDGAGPAEFIRQSLEVYRRPGLTTRLEPRLRQLLRQHWRVLAPGVAGTRLVRHAGLVLEQPVPGQPPVRLTFRRGFVEVWQGGWEDWQRAGASLLRQAPLEEILLQFRSRRQGKLLLREPLFNGSAVRPCWAWRCAGSGPEVFPPAFAAYARQFIADPRETLARATLPADLFNLLPTAAAERAWCTYGRSASARTALTVALRRWGETSPAGSLATSIPGVL